MSSGKVETVQARSMSCDDMYMLLNEEDQDLVKSPARFAGLNQKTSERTKSISKTDASHLRPVISSDIPFVPSDLSLARPVDGGWGWIVVFGAFFVHLIIDGLCCSFGVLFVELYDYFESSRSKISLSGALLYAMPMVFAPISSALIDVYGCRVVGFAGGVLSAIGAISCAFTSSLDCLIVLFGVLIGTGMSLTMTTSFVIIVVFFERRRTLALGLAISGIGVGSIVMPPLLELLIDTYTWRGSLLIISAFLLQAGAFCLLFRPLESAVQQRQRLYLRTLENFSRIVGHGDFLLGKEYLKSSLQKQIMMLRSYVSSHPSRTSRSTTQAVGNSTVETLAWPSGIDDSMTSSSSSSSSHSNVVVTTLLSTKDQKNQHQKMNDTSQQLQQTIKQEDEVKPEVCYLLKSSTKTEVIAPKAEPELDLEDDDEDDDEEKQKDECDDPLLQPDALVDCLREIEMFDNMPDPESYRIIIPDPLLDTIPENAELDLTVRVLNRSLGSFTDSSSSSLPITNGLAYDTYLDLSNPQLDDDDEDESYRVCGRLSSYKSLPSEKSNSDRIINTASQSLGSLVHSKGFESMGEMHDKEDHKSFLCRTSSDPELLRRRQYRHIDHTLSLRSSVTEKKLINDEESWQPLLMPVSPNKQCPTTTNRKRGFISCEAEFLVPEHQKSTEGSLTRSHECVPFASIGRLNLALSMPRLQAYSDMSISTDRRRDHQSHSDINAKHCLSCSNCNDNVCSIYSCFRIFSNFSFLCLFVSNFLVFCFYNMTMFYIGQYSTTLGATSQEMAMLFASLGVANFIGQIVVGLIGNLDSVDIVLFFSITQSLMGVATLIVPLLMDHRSLFIHTVLFGFAISGNDALSAALSVHFVGLEDANLGISFNLFGQGVANFIGPPIIGAVIEMTNSYTPAFIMSGLGLVLSGIIMIPAIIIDRRRRCEHAHKVSKRRSNKNHSSCDRHLSSDVELV